jgi:hypothetical protein
MLSVSEDPAFQTYHPKPRQFFFDLPPQNHFHSGQSFVGKVAHIQSPSKFYVVPIREAKCDCQFVGQLNCGAVVGLAGAKDYLWNPKTNSPIKMHILGQTSTMQIDNNKEKVYSFPSGKLDKWNNPMRHFYHKPGYQDLLRRLELAKNVELPVQMEKLEDFFRIQGYSYSEFRERWMKETVKSKNNPEQNKEERKQACE